jgi:hypothetical protein
MTCIEGIPFGECLFYCAVAFNLKSGDDRPTGLENPFFGFYNNETSLAKLFVTLKKACTRVVHFI